MQSSDYLSCCFLYTEVLMFKFNRSVFLTFILGIGILGCSEVDFSRLRSENPGIQKHKKRFIYKPIERTLLQPQYDENKVSFTFKAYNERGETIERVDSKDVALFENSVAVKKFEISSKSERVERFIDIVFILDVTGSMGGELDGVKNHISKFVDELADEDVTARLCIVTFSDKVKKKCSSFYEDNSSTPENENTKQFKRDISKIKLVWGGDTPENSLAGIIWAAKKTPWKADAQKIAVLVTDAPFHDRKKRRYPRYESALRALTDSKVTLFAVAPDLPGYSSKYNGMPSLTDENYGVFFDLAKLDKGKGFAKVFDQLLSNLVTQFVLSYSIEKNSLDPSLPLKEREVDFNLKNAELNQLETFPLRSNFPEGRPLYKKEWEFADKKSVSVQKVTVNDKDIKNGFRVDGKKIIFDEIPYPGSKIRVTYEDGDLIDHMNYQDYSFNWYYEDFSLILEVYLNGELAEKGEDYTYTHIDGKVRVSLSQKILSNNDPLRVREFGFIDVEFTAKGKDLYPENEEGDNNNGDDDSDDDDSDDDVNAEDFDGDSDDVNAEDFDGDSDDVNAEDEEGDSNNAEDDGDDVNTEYFNSI